VSRLRRQYGILNISQRYRPPWPVTGIALLFTSCSFLNPPVTLSLLGPNILPSTLFPNTLNLCYSLNVRDHFSYPYRSAGKIKILYVLIHTFLGNTPTETIQYISISKKADKCFMLQWIAKQLYFSKQLEYDVKDITRLTCSSKYILCVILYSLLFLVLMYKRHKSTFSYM
jgi:hypothetical protein